jgi:hypothetical protein
MNDYDYIRLEPNSKWTRRYRPLPERILRAVYLAAGVVLCGLIVWMVLEILVMEV